MRELFPQKPLSHNATARYWEISSTLSDEAFRAGVRGALRTAKRFPRISDIISAAREWIEWRERIPTKDEAFANIDEIISDWNYRDNSDYWLWSADDDDYRPKYLHPLIERSVALLDGLYTISDGLKDHNDGKSDSRRQYWRYRIHEVYERERLRWIDQRLSEDNAHEDIQPVATTLEGSIGT